MGVALYGKIGDLCKDLERRYLSCIIYLSPKCHEMRCYKKEAEGVLRELHGGEGDVASMQTLEEHGHKSRSAWSHQKLEESRIFPGMLRNFLSLQHTLSFDFWPPGLLEKIFLLF